MSMLPIKSLAERRADLVERIPRLAQRKHNRACRAPLDGITLGVDDAGCALTLDDTPRLEHMHVIGSTGCGKSTFLLNCILQDIAHGRGVCVLDPHGSHPDSLFNNVLRFLREHQWTTTRRIHIIAPNCREHVVGFNPLAPLPETDPAVIADAALQAFARVWGDEDTHKTPLTKRILRNIFIALAETGHTLADAAQLLDYDDPNGLRLSLIAQLEDGEARRELQRIERLAKQPRGVSDFEANVLGPTNRLAEFLACEAMRLMFSMSREKANHTLNVLDIIDHGHILLVDLQTGPAVSEAATDCLGKLMLRYLSLLMMHRRPYFLPNDPEPRFHPFFVYVDEAHRYMTSDVELLLSQARKFAVPLTLAHQTLGQLLKAGESIYKAVRDTTETKVVFRIKAPEEAQTIAHDVLPLSLEVPVTASIRPVQVGVRLETLQSETYSVHEGEGTSNAVHAAHALGAGRTEMQHWMRALGRAAGTSLGSGSASSTATGFSSGSVSGMSSMEHTSLSYDPNTQSFIAQPTPMGLMEGSAASTSQAQMASKHGQTAQASSRFRSTNEMESHTDAEGSGRGTNVLTLQSRGTSRGVHRTRGSTTARGSSQSFMPLYADLPTTFHSKDSELYIKGEMIRSLPVGRAVIKCRGCNTFLNVPPPRGLRVIYKPIR